tara:strand:- start:210 stop:710 length:501 start_codon:yes stop_codon:yes gene_type:complete
MKENWKDMKFDGFKIPDDYFDSFEERLQQEIKLQNLLPKDTSDFNMPKGYLDKFQNDILKKTVEQKSKVIPLNQRKAFVILTGIAALFILMLYVIKPQSPVSSFDDLTFSGIEDYLGEDGIQDYLNQDDLNQIEESSSLFDTYTMSDDVILEYLENISIEEEILDQ